MASLLKNAWGLISKPFRAAHTQRNTQIISDNKSATTKPPATPVPTTISTKQTLAPDGAYKPPKFTKNKRKRTAPTARATSKSVRLDENGNRIINSIEVDTGYEQVKLERTAVHHHRDSDSEISSCASYSDIDDSEFAKTDKHDDLLIDEDYQMPSTEKIARETKLRLKDVEQRKADGWPDVDVAVYKRLQMRGLEPLMPEDWSQDLLQLPEALFSADEEEVSIKALGLNAGQGADSTGATALENLIQIGARTNDRLNSVLDLSPGQVIRTHIDRYVKWSLRDASLDKHKRPYLPNFVLMTSRTSETAGQLESRMITKLGNLHRRWQDALSPAESVGQFTRSKKIGGRNAHTAGASASDLITPPKTPSTGTPQTDGPRASGQPNRQARPETSPDSDRFSQSPSPVYDEDGVMIPENIDLDDPHTPSLKEAQESIRGVSPMPFKPLQRQRLATSTRAHMSKAQAAPRRSPPQLYGIMCLNEVLAMVSYIPAAEVSSPEACHSAPSPSPSKRTGGQTSTVGTDTEAATGTDAASRTAQDAKIDSAGSLRLLGVFSLGDQRTDVWTALAIAILVVHARDVLLDKLDEDISPTGGLRGVSVPPEEDPDR